MNGYVTRIPSGKDFGFISSKGVDYFFHRENFDGSWNDLIRDVTNGNKIEVEFEGLKTPKGMRAEQVSLVEVE